MSLSTHQFLLRRARALNAPAPAQRWSGRHPYRDGAAWPACGRPARWNQNKSGSGLWAGKSGADAGKGRRPGRRQQRRRRRPPRLLDLLRAGGGLHAQRGVVLRSIQVLQLRESEGRASSEPGAAPPHAAGNLQRLISDLLRPAHLVPGVCVTRATHFAAAGSLRTLCGYYEATASDRSIVQLLHTRKARQPSAMLRRPGAARGVACRCPLCLRPPCVPLAVLPAGCNNRISIGQCRSLLRKNGRTKRVKGWVDGYMLMGGDEG